MSLDQHLICRIYSSETFDQTGDRVHRLIDAAGATYAASPTYCTLEFPIFECRHAYWLHDAIHELLNADEARGLPPRASLSRATLQTLHELVLIGRETVDAAADVFPFTRYEFSPDGQCREVEGTWTEDDLETLRSLEKPLFLFLQHAPRSWETYYLHDV